MEKYDYRPAYDKDALATSKKTAIEEVKAIGRANKAIDYTFELAKLKYQRDRTTVCNFYIEILVQLSDMLQ
jgi:hypothetical protein